jgi:penicillin-binding protein 1A
MAHRFGVTTNMPAYLPVALGAVEITLEEQVASYAVFPNDGIRVKPHLIRKVTNADGITLWEDPPAVNEVIDQTTARTMMGLLQAVIQHGTGAAAAQLNHPLGGKTGTTSDFTDAWFLGFSPSVTCGVWVGYDSNQSLGEKETGAKAALPIWMNVMRVAIAGKDDEKFPGDEQNGQMLRAGVKLPEKLLTHPALTVPAIKSPAQPAAKPTVRPALPAQVSPSKPQPIVKPALDTAPGLDKPRNQ